MITTSRWTEQNTCSDVTSVMWTTLRTKPTKQTLQQNNQTGTHKPDKGTRDRCSLDSCRTQSLSTQGFGLARPGYLSPQQSTVATNPPIRTLLYTPPGYTHPLPPVSLLGLVLFGTRLCFCWLCFWFWDSYCILVVGGGCSRLT